MKKLAIKRWLMASAMALLTMAAYAQWVNPIPAYHDNPPPAGASLPPILSGRQLTGPNFQYAWQKAVYLDAAKVSQVLYRLPCFCRCDLGLGHTSLRSCFEGLHGAECSTCAKEGFYAYEMTLEGKTAEQIRDGIMKKDYEKIDLNSMGM